LLLAEEEIQHSNFEEALEYCTTAIKSLLPYIDNLIKKAKSPSQHKTKNEPKKESKTSCNDHHMFKSSKLSYHFIEKDPVEFLSIGELTELITNPPGRTCCESKFGKAFAICGEKFAYSVFKIVKGTSVPSLESLAQWSIIELIENYCHNILSSGNTPEFDKDPDPVLFCPVHDSSEKRFDDNAMYPTTTMLSNLVRKFVEDLDVCHSVQASLLTNFLNPDSLSSSVCFHTDLFVKQKIISVASYKGNWLSLKDIGSFMKQCELQGDPILLYALTYLKRSYIYFAMNQPTRCTEDSSAILKIPAVLPNDIKAIANLMKARSLYKAGNIAKEAAMLETNEAITWKLQLEYLRMYKAAAVSYAFSLELMNESEFNSEMHECNVEMVICLNEVLAAQRSDCQLKTCCLCWRNSNLRNSHVFPKFILDILGDDGNILVGNQLKGPKQVHWPMLCHECEQRFCNWGETHFKKLFLEKVCNKPGEMLEISHSNWLYYFFASLIWRVYFHFKYKVNFSEVLSYLPFFAMRKFLLTGDTQHLTTDCFLYLFIDKDVFDEVHCKTSTYKSFARRGGGYMFRLDESLYICYFLNFYLVFPIGPIQNTFLLQGFLKRVQFGEGVFVIEEDKRRSMPVFLERFICKTLAPEYDSVLSSLSHQTHRLISRSLHEQDNGAHSNTILIPKVIRCLPTNISVSVNPRFKYNIELQGGFKVKCPPIDCKLAEDSDQRYTLYICEDDKHSLLALYRVYSPTSDHIYSFQLSISNSGEVIEFLPCKLIRNKQYLEIFQKNNPMVQEFLKSVASVMILSEAPPLDVHFLPEGTGELIQLQPDGSLLFPPTFTIGKPIKFKNMIFWLSEYENIGTVAILRLFCEIAYDERPSYDYLLALQFHCENGKVKSIEPLRPPQEQSEIYEEIVKHLLECQSVCIECIELLQDTTFLNHGVVSCLQKGMYVDFFPINQATSTNNLLILNKLGSVDNPVFEFSSWLCSYVAASSQGSSLIVLEKWKISDLPFVIAFKPVSSEKQLPHIISGLSTLPGAPFTSIFMKMISDYCSNDFDVITKNIILTVQGVLKLDSRILTIFSKGCDPLVKEETNTSNSSMVAIDLDPIICLPSDCNLIANEGEKEILELSTDYNLLCAPLKTPLYMVWLCVYKDVHELIVVKTTTGIESVCSSVIVTLDFVAACRMLTSQSAGKFKFYPFSHLNTRLSEVDFVEEEFLASDTFQSNDPQFRVLMACVQILLSQLYQSHNLQTYLPPEFQVDIEQSGELQLLYPHPFIAGPLHQETSLIEIACWLCGEGLGMVKIVNKSTKYQYITALTFMYSGTAVSKLELVELSPGFLFLAQSRLYLEHNASYLITSMFKILCDEFTMRERI
jgi:hypothetical protein